MTQTKSRSRNKNKKSENQETQLNQQEEIIIQASSETNEANEPKSYENEEIIEASNVTKDTTEKNRNKENINNPFLTTMANRIMSRLYELYGYSIKDDLCQRITKRAQAYASRINKKIKDDIKEINIPELYDSILNILSRGHFPSPLDNTYNEILIRAIIEKYEV